MKTNPQYRSLNPQYDGLTYGLVRSSISGEESLKKHIGLGHDVSRSSLPILLPQLSLTPIFSRYPSVWVEDYRYNQIAFIKNDFINI